MTRHATLVVKYHPGRLLAPRLVASRCEMNKIVALLNAFIVAKPFCN